MIESPISPTQRDRLRQLRRDLGLSVRQMADALGCSPRTLRRWEAGTHRIAGSALIELRNLEAGL